MRPPMGGNPPKFKRGGGRRRREHPWDLLVASHPSLRLNQRDGEERSPLFPTVAEGPPGPGPSSRRRGLRDHRLGGREEAGAQASPFPGGFTLGPRAHAGGGDPGHPRGTEEIGPILPLPFPLFPAEPEGECRKERGGEEEARTAARGDDVIGAYRAGRSTLLALGGRPRGEGELLVPGPEGAVQSATRP